jgi:hypothetical protein
MRLVGKEEYVINVGSEDQRDELRNYVRDIFKQGGEYKFSMKPYKAKRSLNQNDYYWAAFITPVTKAINERERELGRPYRFTTDEVHDGLRERFLPMDQKINAISGARYFEPMSTTKLDKQEFTAYLESIAKYAAEEFGIVIQSAS